MVNILFREDKRKAVEIARTLHKHCFKDKGQVGGLQNCGGNFSLREIYSGSYIITTEMFSFRYVLFHMSKNIHRESNFLLHSMRFKISNNNFYFNCNTTLRW